MQWAIDYEGKGEWTAVEEWTDLGWSEVALDERDPTMNAYVLPIEAETEQLTLFIRGWTKWPIESLSRFYVDGVFLEGPVPGEEEVVKVAAGGEEIVPTTGGSAIWLPIAGVIFVAGFALWEARKVLVRAS